MEHSQDVINECWRSIDGYITYQLSNIGRVRNWASGNILKTCLNREGYVVISLYQHGKIRTHIIHQLVASCFIPKPESNCELEVDHIINDKTNNTISNLRWVPHRQNMWNRDKIRKATSSKYIGVSFKAPRHKWQSEIRQNDGRKMYLGLFAREKDAARAYNAKAYELRGNFAVLNDISDDED